MIKPVTMYSVVCDRCGKTFIDEFNGIGAWLDEELTYHWRQYSFEQLEKEMVRVCGLCHKALGIPQDDSVTDFERGQWSVIQNIIGYAKDYSLAAQLCREAGIGYKKIKALQKDCGYSYKEEVNDFLKDSRNDGTDYLKLEE